MRVQRLAGHTTRGHLGLLDAGGLGDEGHRARGAGVHFKHEDHILLHTVLFHFLDGELHIHQSDHVQPFSHGRGLPLELVHRGLAQVVGWQRTGGITTVHAGLFDVLHHAADENAAGVVAHRVHVAFDRVVEETVQQHG